MVSHILQSQQFTTDFLAHFFDVVKDMKQNEFTVTHLLKGKIVANLFYEPSTRTRFSFESAALRLGASKITTENAKDFSSASKGETLEDSIKVMCGYADFIVLRHPENDSAKRAAAVSTVPIINAGAGTGQHPTQALLDVFTIYEKFGRLTNLKVSFVGDLLRGRTVNSLVYLLSKFPGNSFQFVSPDNSKVNDDMKHYLVKKGILFVESDDLPSALAESDVLYVTRVQKERFENTVEYEKAKGKFILTLDLVEKMKPTAIIMHPLPRVDEISPLVDEDPRAVYFQQAKNGLYVRMALLKMLDENSSLL